MTLQFISLFFVTDKTQLGQTEVLTRYLTNMCFFLPLPSISFLYTDQLGEIPLQKLAGQIECRCLHWPTQLLTAESVQSTIQHVGGLQTT